MTIDVSKVGTPLTSEPRAWDSKDAILYALGVGAGAQDPLKELKYTTENSEGVAQEVLPTFVAVMGGGGGGGRHPLEILGAFPLSSILHGEQRVVLRGPIPTSGTVISDGRIAAVHDKGKNANVVLSSVLRDAETSEELAEVQSTLVIRGEGGFGGDPGVRSTWTIPEHTPDAIVSYPTRIDQGLLYRLSGDRNPLHSDPLFALKANLERPILHGLCTFGFVGRALLASVIDDDPARFGEMSARFASPVNPGDVLDTWIWRTDEGAVFQTKVGDVTVLDHGVFRIR